MKLLLLLVALALSAFFSASEAVLLSTNLAKAKKLGKYAYRLKKDEERTIISILIGNNFVNVLASAIATEISLEVFHSGSVAIATFVMTFVLLTFGEIMPKVISLSKVEEFLKLSSPFLYVWKKITLPIVNAYVIIVKHVKSIANIKKKKVISEEEIEELMWLGEKYGELTKYERRVAVNALDLASTRLRQICIPFRKVFAVDENKSVAWLKDKMEKGIGYSRVILYSNRRKNVVGYVKVSDLLNADGRKKLKEFKRPVLTLPGKASVEYALWKMRKEGIPIAVVEDKGKIIGLATLDDVIEELVGDIREEEPLNGKGKVKKR